MKSLFFILALSLSATLFSQNYDLEDDGNSITISETNKNILKIEVKEPLQISVKDCKDLKSANVEGGAAAYSETVRNYMFNYLNSEFYVLNGDFTFTLTINELGKVIKIDGNPKVDNSEIFFEDMRFILRRIKNKWTPASCNGKPITSEVQVKMKFNSVSTDM